MTKTQNDHGIPDLSLFSRRTCPARWRQRVSVTRRASPAAKWGSNDAIDNGAQRGLGFLPTLFRVALWSLLVWSFVACPLLAQEFSEQPLTEDDRDHWSLLPLVRPTAPSVERVHWPRNSIDLFILAPLERKGLAPQPQADRVTLIRRLSFDLIGLPPTPEEVDSFLNDTAEGAYQRLVDRLLASSRYGEHWAQHWLDLARFAETDGFEHDRLRPKAWRYRDWVIRALNRDMPYDRFVQLQLAGDELGDEGEEGEIATAFCFSGPDMPDINSQEERRHNLLNELTSTVGSVLMGLQFGCAQCHDHKYDPISQGDFYRLRAIFEPAVAVQKNKSIDVMRENSGPHEESRFMIRGDWRRPGAVILPAYPRLANPRGDDLSHDIAQQRGSGNTNGKTTGRRAALARWLTRDDHPLTARVIANRIWQSHFGEGLCRTPSDFGLVGEYPSHDQLLDYLATELVTQDWSLKSLHRSIVNSATYRQASLPTQPTWSNEVRQQAKLDWRRAVESDAENEWLARFPRRRLHGEAIRDAMLFSAGVLANDVGGPGVRPPLPEELLSTLLKNQWIESPDKGEHNRRSVYVFARRNLRFPIFDAFDRPEANASCPRRNRSTTAPQSLLLLNSEFSLSTARRLAGVVLARSNDIDEQITLVYRRALSREPSPWERQTSQNFLASQSRLLKQSGREPTSLALPHPLVPGIDPYSAAALVDYCLAMFNSSEFVYID